MNSAALMEDQRRDVPEPSQPLVGRDRAAAIADLATRPSVVAGRVLYSLGKDAPNIASLVDALEIRLASLANGSPSAVRDMLGGQIYILQALVEHSAWRLGNAKDPEGVRVFGGLLLAAERQLCQTVELLHSLRSQENGREPANELLASPGG